ncbi:hypothetical protein DL768_010258 [Monosporascus sp. mg162]|nr:hypothetical protein DL768_010258 [Monosporascus sp. mg162]
MTRPSRPRVTVIGDAAHLMTPFAGVGVNVGMVDALELPQEIVGYVKNGAGQGGPSLAEVISDCEKGMWALSSRDAAMTARVLEVQFQEDDCENMVELMSDGAGPECSGDGLDVAEVIGSPYEETLELQHST